MMKAHLNLQKRKSTLKNDGIPDSLKNKRSRMGSYVDSLEREPKYDFTRGEKYSEDEDSNNVGNNNDEEKTGDNGAVDDDQEEGEYLLGDEYPTATENTMTLFDQCNSPTRNLDSEFGFNYDVCAKQNNWNWTQSSIQSGLLVPYELHKGILTKDADDKHEPSTRQFSHGCYSVKGKMEHGMEDYIFAQHNNLNGYDLGLYAIFDGHSGHDVAKYLQSHLFENIVNEPDFWENPVHAIKRACKATDDEILENIADSRGGSTAVAAILINGVKLVVANVGDSRAIACKNGVAKPLTVDHEPEKERDLVESRGGFVVTMPGNVPRVDGVLAMTRAFGDGRLKDHITAEPDVTIQKIEEDTEFIILASDGLWKVMTNQEACDCIKDVDDAYKASKKLVKEAKSMGSYDDISCVVVMF
ncbi:putative protein-serine/threonine phosphatase [Lupinus albus]|uniref:protein-serine/threonine phosphatase n=1 Tax=Lupinus albus TaxID=3870 RepID=A0A6A4QAM4_LUPAL|nr:putative protein-serine/threonine phosphatase [Lupinus albus]